MTYETAGELINRVAASVGLTPVSNPYTSVDPAFIQLRYLLNSAGQELVGLHEWQKLQKDHSFVTSGVASYALPTDFSYMINQTGWSPTNAGLGLPLGGPLSPQDWAYLTNTNLASSTIFVSFRIAEGVIKILPTTNTGQTINFIYINKNWVLDNDGSTRKDDADATDDTVLYEAILFEKFLKYRYQEAKGFDTTAALGQFQSAMMQWTGRDVPAPILNMARNRIFPYLGWRNIPESNYGLP